ncbi:MAG: tyrosine-type recombinase/integrase [Salinigranum sp.]
MSEESSSSTGADEALRETNKLLRQQIEQKDGQIEELRAEIQQLRSELESDESRPDPPSNDDIVDRYLEWKDRSETTHKCDESVFRRIREYTGDKPLRDLTDAELRGWIESLGVKSTTGYDYLSRLKALFDWMQEQEWGPEENPVVDVRRRYRESNNAEIRRTGKNTGTVLEPSEFAKLLGSIYNKRARAILLLGVKTGLRRKQICLLERDDVNLDDKRILDRYPKGTGMNRLDDSRADTHLIDDETVAVLETWLEKRDSDSSGNKWLFPGRAEGDHLSPSQMTRVMKKITERAATVQRKSGNEELAQKFESFTSHDLRRCFTSWLNWHGCPRDIIQGLRGDADEDMVSLYTQYSETQVREEYEEAIPRLGLV